MSLLSLYCPSVLSFQRTMFESLQFNAAEMKSAVLADLSAPVVYVPSFEYNGPAVLRPSLGVFPYETNVPFTVRGSAVNISKGPG